MQLMWIVIKVVIAIGEIVIAIGEKKNAETLELMGSIRRDGGGSDEEIQGNNRV
ncbi:MAG: hypothetical protein J7J06_04230 [Methanosarcinales archaeon]|nr:hypothetical protein [Methanosarcinales archaeon]